MPVMVTESIVTGTIHVAFLVRATAVPLPVNVLLRMRLRCSPSRHAADPELPVNVEPDISTNLAVSRTRSPLSLNVVPLMYMRFA